MAIRTLQSRVQRNAKNRGVRIVNRKGWGSQHRSLYWRRLITHPVSRVEADTLWQHITVTRDDGTLPGEFSADMREVERIGFERFGSGFSYNFGVDMKTGWVGVGMPLKAKGTHTVNNKPSEQPNFSRDQNAVARAVAFIGMPGDKPSEKAIIAVSQLFAAMMEERALTAQPDYVPHRLVAAKSCPTDAVVAVMPRIHQLAHKWSKRK